ncbi:MAG: hypothetical protein JWM21_2298 [Acidobacteria bacterium]|nr:hypothetical protein [Acidobacteriota bacterium]
MTTSLSDELVRNLSAQLQQANNNFAAKYPGETGRRQPVHTVYGGAHLFKADSGARLGSLAIRSLQQFAPDFLTFAQAIGLAGAGDLPQSSSVGANDLNAILESNPDAVKEVDRAAWMAHTIYRRVMEKLNREPVEDFRIDYEDGYGNRPDAEEDGHAAQGALEVAAGMERNSLPPFIGIRIKPFNEELRARSIRTLDIFVSTLVEKTGKLPANFVVTLPKITIPQQVAVLADLFDSIEEKAGLPAGSLKMEMMIETTQSIINDQGRINLPLLLEAARGRCLAAHFGTYDYTASCSITAAHQHMMHPACDFAKHMMQVSLAGTGIWLSDGATNIMPVAPHRAAAGGPTLTAAQNAENQTVVHRAWKLHYDHVQHSLTNAFYQGWDLHPAQLPTRYAAVYAFFLESLDAASERLRNFVEKAAKATLVGDVFDDAATGQGLLNYFLRALNSGAISEDEALKFSGLTRDELRTGSFVKILKNRPQL